MDSKLQIISGTYRGRKLYLPAGARPTQNLARGAIFNILGDLFSADDEIVVWDAFAGSGALGIETLSRYINATAIFTDISAESLATIKKNTATIAANRISIIKTDAVQVIKKHGNLANLIFVDPPYPDFDNGVKFIQKLTPFVQSGTVLVWEIENIAHNMPNLNDDWEVLRDKKYGRARFLVLRRTSK